MLYLQLMIITFPFSLESWSSSSLEGPLSNLTRLGVIDNIFYALESFLFPKGDSGFFWQEIVFPCKTAIDIDLPIFSEALASTTGSKEGNLA